MTIQDLLGWEGVRLMRSSLDVDSALLEAPLPPRSITTVTERHQFDPDAERQDSIERRLARKRVMVLAASGVAATLIVAASVQGIT